MSARLPLKIGSSDQKGDDVTHWQRWAVKYAPAYAALMGPVDGFYGTSDGNFTFEMKRRLIASGHPLVLNNVFDEQTAEIVGYKGSSQAGGVVVSRRAGAWFYSMPGSGANWDVGPSLEVGKYAEAKGFRHQGVSFAQGGYLGLMGGDSSLSYVESNDDMKKSLYALHDMNPDLQNLLGQLDRGERATQPLDLIYSAYSKSADGLEDWIDEAFGPGGRYEKARGWIRLVINFGNPSKQDDKDGGAPGWDPAGWGIARKIRSAWLKKLVVSITNPMDFYALVPNNEKLRPVFYAEIITADAELPYFAHILNIGVQVALQTIPLIGPLLGGLGGGIGTSIIGGMAGLPGQLMPLFTQFAGQSGQASHDTDVDAKLIEMFTIQGLISTLPQLIGLIAALPGLQNHGLYGQPFPELGNRSGEQVGRDLIDLFVAGKL